MTGTGKMNCRRHREPVEKFVLGRGVDFRALLIKKKRAPGTCSGATSKMELLKNCVDIKPGWGLSYRSLRELWTSTELFEIDPGFFNSRLHRSYLRYKQTVDSVVLSDDLRFMALLFLFIHSASEEHLPPHLNRRAVLLERTVSARNK